MGEISAMVEAVLWIIGLPLAWFSVLCVIWFSGVPVGVEILENVSGSLVALFVIAVIVTDVKVSSGSPKYRLDLTYNAVPVRCANLIIACNEALQIPPHARMKQYDLIEARVAFLTNGLMRIPKRRYFRNPFSQRRKKARLHVGLVAAALREKLLEIDVNRESAIVDLGDMAMRICGAYTEKRMSRLLADHELAGLQPLRNYEALNAVVAGVITLGAAYGASVLGLPSAVLTLITGIVGVGSFNVLVGRSQRSLDLLDAVRGVQRP